MSIVQNEILKVKRKHIIQMGLKEAIVIGLIIREVIGLVVHCIAKGSVYRLQHPGGAPLGRCAFQLQLWGKSKLHSKSNDNSSNLSNLLGIENFSLLLVLDDVGGSECGALSGEGWT